ncbi:MAG: CHAD domain-containing protein [Alphaproteobacteria bacterium]|nr:CHAD domain-containing protein [Alphaproteobacteria bacterium]
MSADLEIELKFVFAEEDGSKVEALIAAIPAARPPVHQHLAAVYYDTPEGELWTQGFVLRVRSAGERRIQTLKRRGFSDIKREEWEAETIGTELDLDLLQGTPFASLVAKASVRHALHPVFEVHVDRSSYWLEAGASLIEASIDRGEITAKGERLMLRELELELKNGELRDSFNLARALVSQAPLHPSLISKAEQGYLLAAGTYGTAAKSSKPHLSRRMTNKQAFQAIGLACLHDINLNILGLEAPDNVEAIHQVRVAIRRLRAALALFKPIVFDPSFPRLDGELKWLAQMFGGARDMDVLEAHLTQEVGLTDIHERSLGPIALCKAKGQAARQAAIKALRSERGRICLLELAMWFEEMESGPSQLGNADEPLKIYVRGRLKKRLKKLLKSAVRLAHLGQVSRHKIRIKAKELRYMADFFSGIPGIANDRKSLKKLVKYCEKIQGALGQLRDAQVMREFLHGLAEQKPPGKVATGSVIFFPEQSQTPAQTHTTITKESSKALLKARKHAGKKANGDKDEKKSLRTALRAYAHLAALEVF